MQPKKSKIERTEHAKEAKTKRVFVRLEPELYIQFCTYAKNQNSTFSEALRQTLRSKLNDLK